MGSEEDLQTRGDQNDGPAVALKPPSPREATHGSRFQTFV